MVILKNVALMIFGFIAMLFVLKLGIVVLGMTFALLGVVLKLAVIATILYLVYGAYRALVHVES